MKILIGKTEVNYIVIELEIEQEYNNDYNYFSLCGDYYDDELITEEDGEERGREYLEDGELWKNAVQNDNTTSSLDDWIGEVLSIDGWQETLGDLYYLDDIDRYIQYSGGGQINMHVKPDNFIENYIPKKDIKFVWSMWKKYHLKDIKTVPKSQLEKIKNIFIKYESDYDDISKHVDID